MYPPCSYKPHFASRESSYCFGAFGYCATCNKCNRIAQLAREQYTFIKSVIGPDLYTKRSLQKIHFFRSNPFPCHGRYIQSHGPFTIPASSSPRFDYDVVFFLSFSHPAWLNVEKRESDREEAPSQQQPINASPASIMQPPRRLSCVCVSSFRKRKRPPTPPT
jgi:hypothetical protein